MTCGLSVQNALDAGVGWLVWRSDDERACLAELGAFASQRELSSRTWSIDKDANAYEDFNQALDAAMQRPRPRPELWIWLDYAPPRALAPVLERKLRSIALRPQGPLCVFVQFFAASQPSPPERHEIMRPSPSLLQLQDQIAARAIDKDFGLSPSQGDRIYALRNTIAQHCIGLSSWQLDLALRMGANSEDEPSCMSIIQDYKAQALNKAKLVELCKPAPSHTLGGLSAYKRWLSDQKHALTPDAKKAGLSQPKGALLVGVPGCGKSLAARVTAHMLELPLYRLDVGNLFTGVLGGSEERMRETLALCERLAPCILWIDEIEKGFGQSSATSDGGTAQRSLATLITWLQEHQSPIFMIATANKIHALPPELTRKGRLDETFFVDLPNAKDRSAILAVYGVSSWTQDASTMDQVIQASVGYSGSELQACVDQAKLRAYIDQRPPQCSDLLHAINATVPLSKARPEDIAALQAWGKNHAKAAQDQA